MNMFCPIIKSNKSRKSHLPRNNCASELVNKGGGGQNNVSKNNTSGSNINNNNNNNNNNINNNDNTNSNNLNDNNTNSNSNSKSNHNINHLENPPIATSIPCRYVTDNFTAVLEDELSVSIGDIVIVELTDGDWSYVVSIYPCRKGFVPSSILSLEQPKMHRLVEPKKKLSRSAIEAHQITPSCQNFHNSTHNLSQYQNQTQQLSLQTHLQLNSIYQNHPNILYESKFTRENFGLFMVINNFIAREENDLSVRPGDYLILLNKDDGDWYWVRRFDDSKEGFVPSKFLCDYEQVKAFLNKGNSTVTMKSSTRNTDVLYMNQIDPKK